MMKRKQVIILWLIINFLSANYTNAQERVNTSKFRRIEEWNTPNAYRTASGAPGFKYFQQRADYKISIVLDDKTQSIAGEEEITYHNLSPDVLTHLWIQLDQNISRENSTARLISKMRMKDTISVEEMSYYFPDFKGGFTISEVVDKSGSNEKYFVNGTMMRLDLKRPLKPGKKYTFKIKWSYSINDRLKYGGRSGYEYFPADDNYLYTIAQFFPRMAVYNDDRGWQTQQFLGQGEFTLPFGDFDVRITVPADFVVGATGELQNASQVLTKEQLKRFSEAKRTFDKPVFIVTPKEALENEKSRSTSTKTWHFRAKNVRDFAFAASRKFIWDAMAVKLGSTTPLAMSFYPKEGNPLWEEYSTRVVAHTLKVYSKYTFDYPYPVAISVHTDRIGMEYPMICFNGGRPRPDGTYSKATKYGMISVIIHEVGHNWFPMIVNSDERQWTWMDEGLNTYLQYLAEQEWEENYPSRRGAARNIVDYMKSDPSTLVPIMTQSESILQFGNNAYGKPATGLNILRETILGRELFDHAFRQYANRWKFKHPTPEDFFRTIEDAVGQDLAWFWRGWFYTTDACDQNLKSVKLYVPQIVHRKENAFEKIESFENLPDEVKNRLSQNEKDLMQTPYFLEISVENKGGLIMPVIVKFTFEDNTSHIVRLPAEVWLKNEKEFSKVFPLDKKPVHVILDPDLETADIDISNNQVDISRSNTFYIFTFKNQAQ
ncbi:aminopeptidase [Thermaurantimonas aggregans]|uniref:Aminopeptidase n=1 Tax=Thermaurantimonas aggregans TaxID=2173829 RepID=A0A401XJU2_9FLAO|nr:M1 family metallopeptidase [Thermaurantimonas aggregans]MCX8148922.1 M1 family metallopeptidase [Thermaurantimonas aggregans]GCD77263.1 aminopeptidase [Thermaurantimonas aggregans]